MDLSNYPSTSKFFNSENNNKLGYLKDETKSQPILEFIGLRCKMYSYKCENSETKKAKGPSSRERHFLSDSHQTHTTGSGQIGQTNSLSSKSFVLIRRLRRLERLERRRTTRIARAESQATESRDEEVTTSPPPPESQPLRDSRRNSPPRDSRRNSPPRDSRRNSPPRDSRRNSPPRDSRRNSPPRDSRRNSPPRTPDEIHPHGTPDEIHPTGLQTKFAPTGLQTKFTTTGLQTKQLSNKMGGRNRTRKKVKHILSDKDEDVEYLIPKKIAKKKPTHAAFDLNLSPPSTSVDELKIQPYSIYLGKGVGVEIKEFRKSYYVAFSKTVDGDVRNRFNLALDQLPILLKAVETLVQYVKDQPSNSGIE
ncbi:uncharacterized protein TNCT_48981 [Trichonephila clavata]|uniref:Uncharacterized protein n=1 Tax=Trichonephila clavata TaxID=2740835 RepID=A0A8X6FFX2_TRICU|nr:uncharacterized protein TNCT_48981 [Trichonephila clavata]